MTQTYVLGFLFDPGLHSVVLIEKLKPAWQAGKLNGVGGKVEQGEALDAAMAREFAEETGVRIRPQDWAQYATLTGADGRHFAVHVFYAVNVLFRDASTVEAEKVRLAATVDVVRGGHLTIGNVPWLVAMAIAVASGRENCAMFQIQEMT